MNAAQAAPRKALVLGGATGMLGQALMEELRQAGWEAVAQGRKDVDLTDGAALADYLEWVHPEVVFNAAAYTQVDKAEDEPDLAMRLNRDLPAALGRLAPRLDFRVIHYSTDFVFDGRNTEPYTLSDEPNPISVYGKTKLAGENALLRSGLPGLLILRTAWLFGPGKQNFVRTILAIAKERGHLGVVHDQIGSPTYTVDLARNTLRLLAVPEAQGIYHVVNSGQASWCELAAEAVSLAGLRCAVNAITTDQYPTRAVRPAYSVLSLQKYIATTNHTPRPWLQALRDYIFQHFDVSDD